MISERISRLAAGRSRIDFAGRIWRWFAISGVVLAVSTLGLVFRGFNLGLEFKGGTSFKVPLSGTVTVTQVRDVLAPIDVGEASVQIVRPLVGETSEVLVRTRHLEPEKADDVKQALAQVAGAASPDAVSFTDVGPTWGRQISNKALRGLVVFLVLVVAYISVRFEPKMAVAALIAVFHDLLATAGIYALVGFEVTPATVIALLTLLGYSLYDTVVVFDKVRENAALLSSRTGETYSDMLNRSVNRVLVRSINTSLTGLLPVGGLLFVGALLLGATTLKDLSLALFVGTAVSTYSSVFVAAPILAWWKEREPRFRQIRARTALPAPPATVAAATGSVAGAASGSAPTARREPVRVSRPATRPRKRRGGKRRR